MTDTSRICAKCIMDTTDPGIQFDDNGVCNHCRSYERRAKQELHYDEAGQQTLVRLVEEIKRHGKKRQYDCVIGLSGGVDSSFVAYEVRRLGLRPLAVSLNNGWDSDLAVNNIQNVARKLNIEVRTCEVNWTQFRDLQLSFLKSSVSNCEIPTDHAIVAFLFRTALQERIRFIITGGNIVTEAIMPESWGYSWRDWRFVRGVHETFGTVSLKGYYHLGLPDWTYCVLVKRIQYVHLLNYIPYIKKDAKRLLEEQMGWKDYGPKHYESVYTRFFQGYILPTKFGFDKRRVHLSNLIWSGQMAREEALREISQNPYPSQELLRQDRAHVLEKLGLSEEEFDRIMRQPVKTFRDYPNNDSLYRKLDVFVKLARRMATRNL